jgi:hypothetical protein
MYVGTNLYCYSSTQGKHTQKDGNAHQIQIIVAPHCTETFIPYIFIPILGTCFFAFQLNLGAFCMQFVDVSLNFDTLKLNWVTKIGIFRISGINLTAIWEQI